jgi:replicative DNA helicase
LWSTSTPTGEHKKFYAYCTNKNLGYKEFWFVSPENPTWTQGTEDHLRREYNAVDKTSPEWDHEILAEFGEQVQGVFRNSAIDAALQDYDMNKSFPETDSIYILGVDWNKNHGTHMVIVQYAGSQFRLMKKVIIPKGEFTQTLAVESIINLHSQWNFAGMYVDAGYGDTQVEMLKKYGLSNPGSKIVHRLKSFEMQKMIEIRDPQTGSIVKKNTKPFLVNRLAETLDDGRLVLPASEDTRVYREDMQMGLVQQMRNFKIEGYSVLGAPKYSQGQEHTLTALMIAVGGYLLDHSDLRQVRHLNEVAFAGGFGDSSPPPEYQASDILKKIEATSDRGLDRTKPIMPVDASSIRDQQRLRKSLSEGGRGRGSFAPVRRNLGNKGRNNI